MRKTTPVCGASPSGSTRLACGGRTANGLLASLLGLLLGLLTSLLGLLALLLGLLLSLLASLLGLLLGLLALLGLLGLASAPDTNGLRNSEVHSSRLGLLR